MAHMVATTSGESSKRRPALRLVRTQGMERQDWLAVRQRGIGSSDSAAAAGLNPYQSPLELWMHKTGRATPVDANTLGDDHNLLYWGQLLEPIVAAHYTRRTGLCVRRVNAVLQHPEHPWMLANIDREVMGSPEVQLLECKTAGIQGARLWRDGVPEYVQLQVMHQLAVTGKQAADVVVLIGGHELQIHRIQRDEGMIEHLIALERDFWSYVENDVPPLADGSSSAESALRLLYPKDSGATVDWSGDLVMSALFSDLLAVRQQQETAGQQEALVKQTIIQRMGDATRAIFDGGDVTFKRSKDGTALDLERLEREQPDLLQSYRTVKPGSRRFLVHT